MSKSSISSARNCTVFSWPENRARARARGRREGGKRRSGSQSNGTDMYAEMRNSISISWGHKKKKHYIFRIAFDIVTGDDDRIKCMIAECIEMYTKTPAEADAHMRRLTDPKVWRQEKTSDVCWQRGMRR